MCRVAFYMRPMANVKDSRKKVGLCITPAFRLGVESSSDKMCMVAYYMRPMANVKDRRKKVGLCITPAFRLGVESSSVSKGFSPELRTRHPRL